MPSYGNTGQTTGGGTPRRIAVAIGISLFVAGAIVVAAVLPQVLPRTRESLPDAPAEAATQEGPSEEQAIDEPSAADRLTEDRSVTERDLAMLSSLRQFLDEEAATRTAAAQLKAASGEDVPEPAPLDDVLSSLSEERTWPEEIPGWDDLLLMVRCAEMAEDAANEGSDGAYRATRVVPWGEDAPEDTYSGKDDIRPAWADGAEEEATFAVEDPVDRAEARAAGAEIDDEEEPLGEVGMHVALVGTAGDAEALDVPAAVDLSGNEPRVVHRRDEAMAARMRMRRRVDDISGRFPEITHENAAIEGSFRAASDASGNVTRAERLWLYVDENAVPSDIDGFIAFVNDVHAVLVETAPEGTVDVSVKVVAVAPDDPVMQGHPLSDLQHELELHNSPGSAYMQFDYSLGGEATSGSPCVEGDLDGYRHPYDWGM